MPVNRVVVHSLLAPLALSLSQGSNCAGGPCGNTLRQAQGKRSGSVANTIRLLPFSLFLFLAACAQQLPAGVAPESPGFLLGLWHGFIFPVAWLLSLFMDDVAIYAVPNDGGWYDFGYFIGVVFLGVGANRTRTIYVDRRRR